MTKLRDCYKKYTQDQDKAVSPSQTVETVNKILQSFGQDLLEKTEQIDTGRLGIPVYISYYGPKARKIVPGRKQMGKGATPEQAQASALMEIVERYSLFSFLEQQSNFTQLPWSEAQNLFSELIPEKVILQSVNEDLSLDKAREILDLIDWRFCPALDLKENKEYLVPIDWFKQLNEFNGSSAGNSLEESIFQGACELVERHLSAIIDQNQSLLPSLDPKSCQNKTLNRLIKAFEKNHIEFWLKDFSLDLGIPTVGVLAYDPKTFPQKSELVFTAGTASTGEKAAIRALTEVAQLAGDFETGSCYEPSGLRKYCSLEDCQWITKGNIIPFERLPDISHNNILEEIQKLNFKLNQKDFNLYTVDLTSSDLRIPASYNMVPGFLFRQRSPLACLGMIVGRILVEDYPPEQAAQGLEKISRIYPQKHFLPFFQGLLELRTQNWSRAIQSFSLAEEKQPSAEEQALTLFYLGYTYSQIDQWEKAIPYLKKAVGLSPDSYSAHNLLGVSYFKQQDYPRAASHFQSALSLEAGSAIDLANLGLSYLYMGNKQKAIQYLQAGLDLDPDIDFARHHLNKLFSQYFQCPISDS